VLAGVFEVYIPVRLPDPDERDDEVVFRNDGGS